MSIRIFYDETDFRLIGWRKVIKLIKEVIGSELKISGDLNVIITSDATLRKINVQFLQHDYNTDVITFNYNEGKVINGEIYIAIETVEKNALNYKISLRNEVIRVIIHGVLHLAGYDDETVEKRISMKYKEDNWMREIEG